MIQITKEAIKKGLQGNSLRDLVEEQCEKVTSMIAATCQADIGIRFEHVYEVQAQAAGEDNQRRRFDYQHYWFNTLWVDVLRPMLDAHFGEGTIYGADYEDLLLLSKAEVFPKALICFEEAFSSAILHLIQIRREGISELPTILEYVSMMERYIHYAFAGDQRRLRRHHKDIVSLSDNILYIDPEVLYFRLGPGDPLRPPKPFELFSYPNLFLKAATKQQLRAHIVELSEQMQTSISIIDLATKWFTFAVLETGLLFGQYANDLFFREATRKRNTMTAEEFAQSIIDSRTDTSLVWGTTHSALYLYQILAGKSDQDLTVVHQRLAYLIGNEYAMKSFPNIFTVRRNARSFIFFVEAKRDVVNLGSRGVKRRREEAPKESIFGTVDRSGTPSSRDYLFHPCHRDIKSYKYLNESFWSIAGKLNIQSGDIPFDPKSNDDDAMIFIQGICYAMNKHNNLPPKIKSKVSVSTMAAAFIMLTLIVRSQSSNIFSLHINFKDKAPCGHYKIGLTDLVELQYIKARVHSRGFRDPTWTGTGLNWNYNAIKSANLNSDPFVLLGSAHIPVDEDVFNEYRSKF
jgi:hypothetical protein